MSSRSTGAAQCRRRRRRCWPVTSRSSMRRWSPAVSSRTLRWVAAGSALPGWARSTSSSVRMRVRGLRSSCEASATNRCWRSEASSSRSSMAFMVRASRAISSSPGGREPGGAGPCRRCRRPPRGSPPSGAGSGRPATRPAASDTASHAVMASTGTGRACDALVDVVEVGGDVDDDRAARRSDAARQEPRGVVAIPDRRPCCAFPLPTCGAAATGAIPQDVGCGGDHLPFGPDDLGHAVVVDHRGSRQRRRDADDGGRVARCVGSPSRGPRRAWADELAPLGPTRAIPDDEDCSDRQRGQRRDAEPERSRQPVVDADGTVIRHRSPPGSPAPRTVSIEWRPNGSSILRRRRRM